MKDCPLVLIHGYPFDHTMWLSSIASLGSNARVIAPDLPGFGRTAVPSGEPPSLEYMADWLAGMLDENQEPRAVVAGMSMGGYVALAFAERHPERLAGLGLISSQAAADTAEARQGRAQTIQKIRESGVSVALDALLPKLFSSAKAQAPELSRYAVAGAERAGVDGLCWALEAMAKRPDRTALISSLDVPVMVAHGSEDRVVPLKKARELVESSHKPLWIELNGVGHASPLEAPDQVAAGLARLVKMCREEEEEAAGSGGVVDTSQADPA